jgi:phage N-6-adenine-methyltransferase
VNKLSKVDRRAAPPAVLTQLRKELVSITSPKAALNVMERSSRAKRLYEAIGRSVAECNDFAELYLSAYWKFGQLVAGVKAGRPEKTGIDTGFPGTETQRKYARRLQQCLQESQIPEYVKHATDRLESASIAGCLEWIDPGRHGNLRGEYEWYTPLEILEAVRSVLGGIDLDPASCEDAQATVRAARFFTEEDDGLAQDWTGRVFLNPPFAHPTVKYFAEKFLASFQAGAITGVFLSNACTDTPWWQALAKAGPVCFPAGRIRFHGPHDHGQSPTLGQTLIYLGDEVPRFRDVFSTFGAVLRGSALV